MKLHYFLVPLLFLVGCSGSEYSYVPSANYSENDQREITDEDIQKAFESKPQIKFPAALAWYSLGYDTLYRMLKIDNENVAENYLIPKTLVEGFSEYTGYRGYRYEPTQINLKSLRLLAARAKCDLLILVAAKLNVVTRCNDWCYFNVFILPIFFTSYLHVNYQYDAEVFIFDVRNGYMYKHTDVSYIKKTKFVRFSEIEKASDSLNVEFQNKASKYFIEQIRTTLFNESNLIDK